MRTPDQKQDHLRKIKATRAKHLAEDPDFNKKIDTKSRATKVRNGHSPIWNNPEKNRETLERHKREDPWFMLELIYRKRATKAKRHGDPMFTNHKQVVQTRRANNGGEYNS